MLPGGRLDLVDDMTMYVGGNLRVDGSDQPFCPAVAAWRAQSASQRGIIPPSELHIRNAASLAVDGDLYLDLAIVSINDSAAGVLLGGGFKSRATFPGDFDWSTGRLELNGQSEQLFEVAWLVLGPTTAGVETDADTLFDTRPHTNFSIGEVEVAGGSEVTIVNQHANTAGAGPFQEALYVDTLVLNAGSSITLDNCRVYCNRLIDNGAQIETVGFGTLLVDLSKPVPTVAEWGVVTMTLFVLTAGTLALARRRRHAAR
jgi:hypothetical protein